MMSTLKERLEELMNEYGLLTQQDLANFAGVSKGLVGQWFKGDTGLGKKPLMAFEQKTKFSTRWLADGLGDKYKNKNNHLESNTNIMGGSAANLPEIPEGIIRFEHLNVVASMGNGTENSEFVEVVNYVAVAEKWARDHLGSNLKDIRVITAKGDSMSPTIKENSVLFVDSSITFFDGEGIYIVHTPDGLKAKRLQMLIAGGLNIISDNPQYRLETISPDNLEAVKICGKVRGSWALSEFK